MECGQRQRQNSQILWSQPRVGRSVASTALLLYSFLVECQLYCLLDCIMMNPSSFLAAFNHKYLFFFPSPFSMTRSIKMCEMFIEQIIICSNSFSLTRKLSVLKLPHPEDIILFNQSLLNNDSAVADDTSVLGILTPKGIGSVDNETGLGI